MCICNVLWATLVSSAPPKPEPPYCSSAFGCTQQMAAGLNEHPPSVDETKMWTCQGEER